MLQNYFASAIKIKIDEKILVEERIHAGDIVQHFNKSGNGAAFYDGGK